jgi:UDP-glucuronate 4-epimerase
MAILVTGAAGFIGYHTCRRLLDLGEAVIGVDIVNDYYDPALKEARIGGLAGRPGFTFCRADIADREAMAGIAGRYPDIRRIVHLAAQPGVRYSLVNPHAYTRANVEGQLVMLEMARALPVCEHFVYASSSSVYGANEKRPFAVEDRVDHPVSLYAATKKAGELMAYTYSHLYGLPTTGLRFFTVYGPWGRPDMSAWLFVKAILAGEPVKVFNGGDMRRDFTYIDDIIDGVAAVAQADAAGYRLYNIGNNRSEPLMRFIGLIEQAVGRKAELVMAPMQPGDVKETFADIDDLRRDFGFEPKTTIDEGIPRFVAWYRDYHRC